MYKYTILSLGDVNSLHASIANAFWILTPPSRLEVFSASGASRPEEVLQAFLDTRIESDENRIDFLIFDNIRMHRYKRFKVLTFGFLEKLVERGILAKCEDFKVLYLPTSEIHSDNKIYDHERVSFYEGVIPDTPGALCVSPAGVEFLKDPSIDTSGIFCMQYNWVIPFQEDMKQL